MVFTIHHQLNCSLCIVVAMIKLKLSTEFVLVQTRFSVLKGPDCRTKSKLKSISLKAIFKKYDRKPDFLLTLVQFEPTVHGEHFLFANYLNYDWLRRGPITGILVCPFWSIPGKHTPRRLELAAQRLRKGDA
jgi:hypothetical protein